MCGSGSVKEVGVEKTAFVGSGVGKVCFFSFLCIQLLCLGNVDTGTESWVLGYGCDVMVLVSFFEGSSKLFSVQFSRVK